MSDDPELLPCPFCGTSIDLRKSEETIGGSPVILFLVAHPDGNCPIRNYVNGMFISPKDAAGFWNRRYDGPRPRITTERPDIVEIEEVHGFPHPIETGVLRALSGAADDLLAAETATNLGLVSDHCAIALRAIKTAMRTAIGD